MTDETTDETTVIHPRIPVSQYEFIERMVETPEFDSKAHVVKYALHQLQIEKEGESH